MKRLFVLIVSLVALSAAGCSFGWFAKGGVVHGSSQQQLSPSSARECAPNQHWDGDCCRHNGRGQGARKHDAPDCP